MHFDFPPPLNHRHHLLSRVSPWNRRTARSDKAHMFQTASHTVKAHSIVWKCYGSIITVAYCATVCSVNTWKSAFMGQPSQLLPLYSNMPFTVFSKGTTVVEFIDTNSGLCHMFQTARRQKAFTVSNPHFLTQCCNTCELLGAIVEEGGGGYLTTPMLIF